MKKTKKLLVFSLAASLMLSIISLALFTVGATTPVAACAVTVAEYNVGTEDYYVGAEVTFTSDTAFTAGMFTVEAGDLSLTECTVAQSVGGEAPQIDANYTEKVILFTGFSDSSEDDFRSYTQLTLSLKFAVEGGLGALPEGSDATVAVKDIKIANVNEEKYSTEDAQGSLHIHLFGENWVTDNENHWHACSACTAVADKAAHTGGTANCHAKAICEVCGAEYGEYDADNHDGETEIRNAKEATETKDGYTGDTYCIGCGALMAAGEVIPATGGEPGYTPGDINGDGEVDNKDLTRLFQYLSNWEVEVNEEALDVNGDGSVDNKDLTRLFQYLSNWDVEIF